MSIFRRNKPSDALVLTCSSIGFKDSRIQIDLFATTNTFCYGINKHDIKYNLQDKLLIITNNEN